MLNMIVDFFKNVYSYILWPFFVRYWKRLFLIVIGSYTFLWIGHQKAWFRSPLIETSVFEAFSDNTALILEIPQGKGLPSNLQTAHYSVPLFQLSILNKWKGQIKSLKRLWQITPIYEQLLAQTTIVSGVQVVSNQESNWLHVLKNTTGNFQVEHFIKALQPKNVQKSTYRERKIYTLDLGKEQWTIAVFRGLILMSSSTLLVESSIEQLDNIEGNVYQNTAFQKVIKVKQNKPTWNIYLNFKALPFLTNVVTKTNPTAIWALRKVGDWMRLDAQFLTEDFNLTGRLYPDSENTFLQALAGQKAPDNTRIMELLPSNLGALLYLAWGNYEQFYKKYNKSEQENFEQYIKPWLGQDAALFYEDPTDEQHAFEKDKLVFLHSIDTGLTWKLLHQYADKNGGGNSYGYQNFEITHLPVKNVLAPLFGDLINPLQEPYFTIIGEYIVFANSKTTLEGWVKSFNTRQLLLLLPEYQAFLKQGSEEANIYVLVNTLNTNKFIQYFARESLLEQLQASWKKFKNIYPIGIKLYGQGQHFLTTFSASYNELSQQKQVKATSAWQADLNGKAIIAPQAVHSHDGNYYIVVQDEHHQVYLLDKNGENQWPAHKVTNRPINSPIYEVDYYNNNEIQYAFSTDSAIYIFTKEGETLMTIPLIHRAASGVLAINNKKGPRFFVPCKNNTIYGYEETGKPLSGWQPLKGAGRAAWPMHYMEYNEQRYFVQVTKAGHCHAYEQTAKPHFKHASLGRPVSWGLDPIIGRIAAGQANGKIKIINSKGKGFSLAAVPELQKKHVQFLYADVIGDPRKDYIRMDANKMVIHYYEKQVDEQGKSKDKLQHTPVYTIPEATNRKIFAVNLGDSKKQLIGYWEPEKGSVGLLNAQGELQKGFPLAGTSAFVVIDLFQEQSNTLVVANENRIYTYKLK